MAWTPKQAAFFLDGLDDDPRAAAWHLALISGARRGELCGARWDLLDLDAGLWLITSTAVQVGGAVHDKAAKSWVGMRAVYLDAETVAVLREHRKRQVSPLGPDGHARFVFTAQDGTPVKPDALSRAWVKATGAAADRQAREAAGGGVKIKTAQRLPRIKLHETRHTANTIARLYAKVDPAVLLQRMGHTEDTTNARYTHGHPGLHRQAAEDIAAEVRRHRRGAS